MRARHPLSAEHTKKSSAVAKHVRSEEADGIAFREGLLEALLEIGRERQAIMDKMREALLRGDDRGALERARELTGLPSTKLTASSIAH